MPVSQHKKIALKGSLAVVAWARVVGPKTNKIS